MATFDDRFNAVNELHYDPLKRDTLIGELDPFRGAYNQTNRMRAYVEVIVDGVDITNKIEPFLISVRFRDGKEKDCEIEIDDRDGRLPIPPLYAPLQISLGWAREGLYNLFHGTITDLEHGFGRKQGGRRMWVKGKGLNDVETRFKEPMQDVLGQGAPPGQKQGAMHGLPDWIKQIGKNAGVSTYVNSAFSKFKQDHWQMMGASPMHEFTSLADKFGSMLEFGPNNTVSFLVPGERGVSCRAVWRDNLIGYRVRPWEARTSYGGAQSMSFDNMAGEWLKQFTDTAKKAIGPGIAAVAKGGSPGPQATEQSAGQANEGAGTTMDSASSGQGRIVINGEPRAQYASMVSLEGVRPGVDGHYHIWIAEHIYSRQGYVTWLDVTPVAKAEGSNNVWYGFQPRPQPNIG